MASEVIRGTWTSHSNGLGSHSNGLGSHSRDLGGHSNGLGSHSNDLGSHSRDPNKSFDLLQKSFRLFWRCCLKSLSSISEFESIPHSHFTRTRRASGPLPVHPPNCPFVRNMYRSSQKGFHLVKSKITVSNTRMEALKMPKIGHPSIAQSARSLNETTTSSFQSARSYIPAARSFFLF